MSHDLDGTYAIVATSLMGCLAGVCVICQGKLDGNDFEGGRYQGNVSLQGRVVDLDLTMEGPASPSAMSGKLPSQKSHSFRLRESISTQEWRDGGTIHLKNSGTWLIVRQISEAMDLGLGVAMDRCAA